MHAELEELARLERLVADALTAADPVAELRRAARDESLPADLRAALERADEDGVRLSALLVARLRFERLMQGSRAAARWFEEDARAFTEAFRTYHRSVAPTAPFPGEEGARFEEWLASRRDEV